MPDAQEIFSAFFQRAAGVLAQATQSLRQPISANERRAQYRERTGQTGAEALAAITAMSQQADALASQFAMPAQCDRKLNLDTAEPHKSSCTLERVGGCLDAEACKIQVSASEVEVGFGGSSNGMIPQSIRMATSEWHAGKRTLTARWGHERDQNVHTLELLETEPGTGVFGFRSARLILHDVEGHVVGKVNATMQANGQVAVSGTPIVWKEGAGNVSVDAASTADKTMSFNHFAQAASNQGLPITAEHGLMDLSAEGNAARTLQGRVAERPALPAAPTAPIVIDLKAREAVPVREMAA